MKSSLKKINVVLVLLAVLLSVFSGCKGVSENAVTTGTAGSTAGSTQTAASQTEKAKEKVSFTWVWKDRKAAADGDADVLNFLNEKFNIDLKYADIPSDQIDEKISVMLASGDNIDCFFGYFNAPTKVYDVNRLVKNGQIQPLNKYLETHGKDLLDSVPEDNWQYTKDDKGNIWFVPDVTFKGQQFLFVRKDWMEKFNLSAPKTIEEFEQMLITFRDGDPDGNGKADTYPLITSASGIYRETFSTAFIPTGQSWYEDNGKLLPFFMHPNFKLFMETLGRWYKAGLIHPEQAILKTEQVREIIAQGVSGVHPEWYSLSYQNEAQQLNPDAEFTYIDYPVGPSGTSGSMTRNLFSGGLVIHSNVKPAVAERIIELLNYLQTPEGSVLINYGIENKHWVLQDGKIAPAPGVDPAKPAYKGRFIINGGNFYMNFKESSLITPELTSITRQLAIAGKNPTIDPVDFMFPYDWRGTKSEGLMSDLDVGGKMFDEMYIKLLTGEKTVSWLDEWLDNWLKSGGETYIQEKTEQYLKLKPIYGKK